MLVLHQIKTKCVHAVFLGFMLIVVVVGSGSFLSCANTGFDKSGKDEDQDGFPAIDGNGNAVDCDDTSAGIYPGATELENCKDDNCDGQLDEGTPNWDRDNDGYCPNTGDEDTCEGNPTRNPAALEDGGSGTGLANNIDDNCNGIIDEGLPSSDQDLDGYTLSDGDCGDGDPFVNPGAIEVEGVKCTEAKECASGDCRGGYCRCTSNDQCSSNLACIDDVQCEVEGERCIENKCRNILQCLDPVAGMAEPTAKVCRDNIDNDCNGKIDEMVSVTCDALPGLNPTNPFDYAKAIDICETGHTCGVDKGCPKNFTCVDQKCLRVISASFNGGSDALSRGIDTHFAKEGPIVPRGTQSFAVFSSGVAIYKPGPEQSKGEYCPEAASGFGNIGVDPDPTATDKEANDLSQLTLRVVAPTNAQSFSFDFHFFTSEYPEYLGTQFNDTFWVELKSKKFTGNISFDKNGTPIRLNNAFFSICDPDPSKPATKAFCEEPASVLMGTGYASDCYGGGNDAAGGSTGWLTTTSPIEPGETFELIFSIFDKGDDVLDSAVVIDNFRWSLKPATKPVTIPD